MLARPEWLRALAGAGFQQDRRRSEHDFAVSNDMVFAGEIAVMRKIAIDMICPWGTLRPHCQRAVSAGSCKAASPNRIARAVRSARLRHGRIHHPRQYLLV